MKTLCLAPGDLLLHLCLHLADDNHFVGQLRALCDIAATVRRYNEEIDWTSVLEEAHAYEAEQFLYYALWLARHMLDAGIPAEVLGDLQSSIRIRPLEDLSLKFVIQRAILTHGQATSTIPPWVLSLICAELLSAKGTGDKVRTIFTEFCHRYVRSAQQSSLQHRLHPSLYTIFVHPFYLIVRAAGRIPRQGGKKGAATKTERPESKHNIRDF